MRCHALVALACLSAPACAASNASILIYSWQPLKHITGGSDGARHAGMSQRLIQVVRAACRLGLEPTFLSGQSVVHAHGDRSRGTVYVGGCRVGHYHGSTAAQHAHMSADGVRPLFALIFYTAAWFAIEQRAIRNATGWSLPELYLDEESSAEGGRSPGTTTTCPAVRVLSWRCSRPFGRSPLAHRQVWAARR
jgi:hypothetical protein